MVGSTTTTVARQRARGEPGIKRPRGEAMRSCGRFGGAHSVVPPRRSRTRAFRVSVQSTAASFFHFDSRSASPPAPMASVATGAARFKLRRGRGRPRGGQRGEGCMHHPPRPRLEGQGKSARARASDRSESAPLAAWHWSTWASGLEGLSRGMTRVASRRGSAKEKARHLRDVRA